MVASRGDRERLKGNPPILKSKGLWGESATNARCKGLQRALVADGREGTAVASRFRLVLAAALRLRGFTQAVPPLRLRLAAANTRPKRNGKRFPGRVKFLPEYLPGNAFAGVAPVNHRLMVGAVPRFRVSRQPTRHFHKEQKWIGSSLTHPGRSAQERRVESDDSGLTKLSGPNAGQFPHWKSA